MGRRDPLDPKGVSGRAGKTRRSREKHMFNDRRGVMSTPTSTAIDPRRHGVIEVRFQPGPPAIYQLTIDDQLWASVEWSPRRRRWCIEDGVGRCLAHVEHIHGEDVDAANAVRLAKAMIQDGRMPTPEEANEALRRRRQAPIEGLIGMAEDLVRMALDIPNRHVLVRNSAGSRRC
jgi:hypothetical protein